MTEVVDRVKKSDTDLVVILGTKHARLINMLDRETAVFRLPLVTIMISDISDSIDLRLDTNILIIEQSDNSDAYELEEIYSIKKGKKIKRVIGSWSRSSGLSMEVLDV